MILIVRRAALLLLFPVSLLFAQVSNEGVRHWNFHPSSVKFRSALPNLVTHIELRRPKIGLVLSGGGARGIASIGVLRAFEKAHLPIDFIVGTSMGSIVGGLYAAGYSIDELTALIDSTSWGEILSLGDDARRSDLFYDQKLARDKSLFVLRFDGLKPVLPEAFSAGQRLTNYLSIVALQAIYHPSDSFDDLKIPFRSVATDLVSGKRVILDKGDLSEALRASVTVPLFFSPVVRDTTELLDGGLVSNIPADVARQWGADIVVVVDVTSPLRPVSELNTPWGVADQIIGITMQAANQLQLKNADFVIRPELGSWSSTNFTDLDSLIGQGEASAEQATVEIGIRLKALSDEFGLGDSGSVQPADPVIALEPSQREDPLFKSLLNLEGRNLTAGEIREGLSVMYEMEPVQSIEFLVEQHADRSVLRPSVKLNPVLKEIRFAGAHRIPSDSLKTFFSSLLGRPANYHEYQHALEQVLQAYRNGGYSLARIMSATLDSLSGLAFVEVDEGAVYRRTITGTEKTKDYVIWRELPWKQGDVFEIDQVSNGLRNLHGTGLFEQVSLNVRKEGQNGEHQIIIIRAQERATDLIRLGMTVDNERNVQPSVDVRDENFLGIASELGIHFFGGLRNRYYAAEFKANRVFNSYLTFNLRGYYGLKDVNVFKNEPATSTLRWNRVRDAEYREVREGVSLSLGMQLERLGQVTAEARSEHQRVWSIFNQPVASQSFHVSSIKLGTKIDSRDQFPYPRSGIVMEFSYESGFVSTTDRLGFTKMVFNYSFYQTFFDRQTLSPRVQFGFGDETVPLTEMFTLGGQESFYGFREDDARGRQLFAVGLEYRYFLPIRILFDSYFKLRYDLGHIWEKSEQIRLKDMRHGVGVGLGLDTPIGPAEVSVGRAFFIRKDLFDNPLSFGPFVAYFKVGYAF